MSPLSLVLGVAAEAPTPPPTPEEFTIYNVTPGIGGFITFFVLAMVGWLLFRSLVRHIRKVDMATAQRERADAEALAAAEPAAAKAGAGEPTAGEPVAGESPPAAADGRGQPTE